MGGAAIVPLLTTIAGSVVSSVLAPKQSSPDLPAPPPVAEAPEVPKVAEADEAPVVDTEAARARAAARRRNAEQARLFSLGSQDDDATVLTKSLLGGD